MFDDLQEINRRPAPWERYTADQLWADPWVSSRMLAFHLDGSNAIASRSSEFIKRAVGWMTERFGLGPGKRVADFGCGPGLYAQGLAKSGAAVTGLDFSPRSIAYAQDQAQAQGLDIDYRCENYLEFDGEARFDLITLIYCDLCALSPTQRAKLLAVFRGLLRPGGALLLDVFSLARFQGLCESTGYEFCPGEGFWAQEPHYVFQNSFKYEPQKPGPGPLHHRAAGRAARGVQLAPALHPRGPEERDGRRGLRAGGDPGQRGRRCLRPGGR